MKIHELVIEMKLPECRLTLFEEKYGILSEDFYEALTAGKLARYDEYDEPRADFRRWKGIYSVSAENITLFGIWLFVKEQEYFLSYENYPYFKNQKLHSIQNVQLR